MIKREHIAYRVSIISIILTIFLTIFKIVSGIIGNSQAILSDAVHSLSDVLSTIVVIIGIKVSSKANDKNHPYGHERFECVASIVLSFMLFYVGITIGLAGIRNIISNNYNNLKIPSLIALIASIVSILLKEGMFLYTKKWAKKINSDALLADAYHHRSDALSSIGSLLGVGGTMLGFTICDTVASLIICLFIFKVSIDIFRETIDKLVDKSCDDETINIITNDILDNKQVIQIDLLKTRIFGNKIYADIEIAVDKNLSLIDAHEIAEDVHNYLEKKHNNLKHCMIHVNPYSEGSDNNGYQK